jgi:hydrogenase-1 operon protein HyaF
MASKPFPIPVRMIGPGSQVEDDTLEYITMPKGMETWHPPLLPEADEVANLTRALDALRSVAQLLDATLEDGRARSLDISGMDAGNRALINQVLGEGEVSALIDREGATLRVQESVFAGIWRVLDGLSDRIEIGAVPSVLLDRQTPGATEIEALSAIDAALPAGVINAPAILAELAEHLRRWKLGASGQVINLTLLPLSPEDLSYLGLRLGHSGLTILSRGYGNCRVTRTALPRAWQVVYYNSQDQIILNTLEVTDMPDVVRAAEEDLQDSRERFAEALVWLEGPA